MYVGQRIQIRGCRGSGNKCMDMSNNCPGHCVHRRPDKEWYDVIIMWMGNESIITSIVGNTSNHYTGFNLGPVVSRGGDNIRIPNERVERMLSI